MDRISMFFDRMRIKLGLGSLTIKVILGVSLILIPAMGLFTYYDMLTRVKYHLKEQEEWAYEISDTVMRSIQYPMLDGEMEDVQAILEKLNTLTDVAVVDLCDTGGTVKYSGLPANIGTVDDSEITRRALLTSSKLKGLEMADGGKVLRHVMPIPNEETCHKCHGAEKKILGVLTVRTSWTPIEERIAELRNREIILGVISLLVLGFFLSLFLTKYITQPLVTLTRLADEISRGKPGFEFGRMLKCWEELKCKKTDCPAYGTLEIMCWYMDGTLCWGEPSGRFPEKLDKCRECSVYRTHVGDEMVQLADSFKHMLYRIKVFEEELRKSEEKYKILFDTDPNPILILERETLNILDANARAEGHYGYSKEELLKMSFMDLGYEKGDPEIMSALKGISGSGRIFLSKKQHRTRDGRPVYVNIHVCGARYAESDALIATTTDITESIQKEAQLTHASKLTTLGEMAAGVAHELNQPLSAIQIGTDFFRDMVRQGREIPRAELVTVSEQIAEQVSRAVGIINHLREFGRKPEMQREEIDINKPIEGVFTLLGQQLKVRGIKIVLDLKDDLPPVMGDNNRLEQVFIDMVINARDAMEEKKERWAGGDLENTLTIRSFQQDGQVVVTITDTGTGIPDEMKEKIFEPFFTTKEVGKGTGLGLAISYGIVKEYDGTIEVESEEENGTTFRISFPACNEGRKGV